MAKRKRLNKRVAVLLGVVGAVLVALAMTVVIYGRGGALLNWLFPKDPKVLLEKALAAAQARNYAEADKVFQEAIGAARASSADVETYYYQYARFNRAWCDAGTGLTRTQRNERFHTAIASLRRAMNRNPTYLEAQQFLCDLQWDVALASQGHGWKGFITDADVLLKLSPEDHRTWFRRGRAKAALTSLENPGQDARDALADLQRAIDLKKDEVSYWLGVIDFLARLPGQEPQAEETLRKAVEANPTNARLLIAYANYLRAQKKTDLARAKLEEAIRYDGLLGNLAMSDHYAALGQLQDAASYIEKARQTDPGDSQSYIRQARLLSLQNRNAEAAEALRQGLEAVEKAAATMPAEPKSRDKQVTSQRELRLRLADLLLDMVEAGAADRAPLVAGANESMKALKALDVKGPLLAQIAGRIHLAEGRRAEALEELETAYRESPGFNLKVAELLINIYLAQNLPGKADAVLDRLLSIPGQQTNVLALMAKARLLMRYRDVDRADAYVSRVLKIAPDNADALNLKTIILALKGEAPSLPAGPGEVSAETLRMLLDRAAALWLDDRRDEAIRYVEQLRSRAPKERSVIGRLYNMYHAAGRLGDAEKLMDDAVSLWPDDKTLKARKLLIRETDPNKQYDILMSVADEYAPPQRELEKAFLARSYKKKAEELSYLQAAAKADANAPAVVESLFRFAMEGKDWKLAEQWAAQAGTANADGSGGRYFRARLCMARDDVDGAIAATLEALKASPNRKDIRVLLGQAYFQKRLYDQAYEAYKMVADNDPGYAPALIGLAAVTHAQNKLDEHRAWVRAAHRLAPDHPYIRAEYLAIERENASPDELIRERERAAKRSPDDLGNLAALAWLYERVNRLQEAEDSYLKVHEKSPDKLTSARLLCGFHLRRGRMADVEQVIKPLLEGWRDRVGVRVLYGEILTPFDQAQARSLFEQAVAADVKDPRGHLGLARYYAALRDWPKASESMAGYVRLRPDDVGGAKELIAYAIEAGEFDAASRRLEEILRANPSDVAAITLKGALALRQGKPADALRLFGQAIQDNPTYAEPLIYRAQVYLAQGDSAKAKADLQAAKRLGNRLDVAMQLARVYVQLQDYDNAELVLREIHADRRSYAPALDQLLSILFRRQKWAEMEKLLADAKTIFPRNASYLMVEAEMWRVREQPAKRQEALATAVQLAPEAPAPLGAYLAALQEGKEYNKLLEATWPHLGKPGISPWVASYRAAALAKLNRLAEADQLFLSSLEKAESPYVLMLVRQVQQAYGLSAGAEKLRQWLQQQPDNWRLHLVLGVLYKEGEQYPEALAGLEKARDLAKEAHPRYLANKHIGATLYAMGKFPEAEKAYLACLQANPDDAEALNNLAYLYTENLDQPKTALPHAERAATALPSNAKVLDTYGWTLARLERYTEAEQVLVRAVQLENVLAASRYHLGWVYEKLKRLDEAQKQYKQGYEMVRTSQDDPLYKPLQEAIERVRLAMEAGSGR